MAANVLMPGNSQLLVASDNVLNSGCSGNHSGSMQKKCGQETDEEDSNNHCDADTFQQGSISRDCFL